MVSRQLNSGSSSNDWTDVYNFYDGLGELAQVFYDGTGSGGWNSKVMRYDNMGRSVLVTNPFDTGGYGGGLPVNAGSGDPITTTSYDPLGRVKIVTTPTGEGSTTTTTAEARVDYDGSDSSLDGILTTVTNQAGKLRRQKVDGLGRVIRSDEPNSSGQLDVTGTVQQPTSYVYNVLDNLVKITQGDQSRQH